MAQKGDAHDKCHTAGTSAAPEEQNSSRSETPSLLKRMMNVKRTQDEVP
jgi:hypothetical protein